MSTLKTSKEITESDKLIYENCNIYRLHADNLRWTLLGGYVAAIIAFFSFTDKGIISFSNQSPIVPALLFIVSFSYLWILAVQNWFYNLFSKFSIECENRLYNGIRLGTLEDFAHTYGKRINPFHPAFILAEIIVASIAYYFLILTINNLYIPVISEYLRSLSYWVAFSIKAFAAIMYFAILNFMFFNWDEIVYKGFITKLSNFYSKK